MVLPPSMMVNNSKVDLSQVGDRLQGSSIFRDRCFGQLLPRTWKAVSPRATVALWLSVAVETGALTAEMTYPRPHSSGSTSQKALCQQGVGTAWASLSPPGLGVPGQLQLPSALFGQ